MNQFECSAAPPLPPQDTMDGALHTVQDEPVGSTADLAMISLVLGLCSGFYVGSVSAITFGHVMKWGILASVLWLVVSFVVAVVVGVVVVRSKLRGVIRDEQIPNVTPRSKPLRSRIGIAAGAKDAQLSA